MLGMTLPQTHPHPPPSGTTPAPRVLRAIRDPDETPPRLLFMVQICGLPDRSLANAIRVPSGDQLGWPSCLPELVSRLTASVAIVLTKISELLVPVMNRL